MEKLNPWKKKTDGNKPTNQVEGLFPDLNFNEVDLVRVPAADDPVRINKVLSGSLDNASYDNSSLDGTPESERERRLSRIPLRVKNNDSIDT